MTQPACMTDREYELWSAANGSISASGNRAKTPCWDCPLAFAESMRAEGCCDGEPGTPRWGRARVTVVVAVQGRGNRYDTAEARTAARRQSWRDYKRRARSVE